MSAVAPPPDVAVFDFDRTVTTAPSLVPFLVRLTGAPRAAVDAAVALLGTGFPPERSRFKAAAVGRLVRGRPIAEVRQCAERFVDDLVDHALDPQVVDLVAVHRARGDLVMIATSALSVYVSPVAMRLGIDLVVAADLDVDDKGICTGGVRDGDLHGHRKVEVVTAFLAEHLCEGRVFAYGNSRDDQPLIEFALSTQRRPRPVTRVA